MLSLLEIKNIVTNNKLQQKLVAGSSGLIRGIEVDQRVGDHSAPLEDSDGQVEVGVTAAEKSQGQDGVGEEADGEIQADEVRNFADPSLFLLLLSRKHPVSVGKLQHLEVRRSDPMKDGRVADHHGDEGHDISGCDCGFPKLNKL